MPGVPPGPAEAAALIQTTLVPAVMISAVGLIALVVQNRHALVLDRAYRINLQRLGLWDALQDLETIENPTRERWIRTQFQIHETLLNRWLKRGTYTRNALVAAFLGVFLFGLTILDLVFNVLLNLAGNWVLLTIGLFVAGIVAFLFCFGFVLMDVYQGLWITRLETAMVNRALEEPTDSRRRGRAA